jgi:hypothetical protein
MIQKGTKVLLALYIIVAVSLWAMDFLEVDVTPLIDWLGLPADFLGATGIAGGIGFTSYQVIRTAQIGLQTTTQNSVKTVNESLLGVFDKLDITNAQEVKLERKINELTTLVQTVLEFNQLLAEKNKQSRLLNDESKAELDAWIKKTELRVKAIHDEVI